MVKDWQCGNTKRIKKIENRHLMKASSKYSSIGLVFCCFGLLELNSKFDRFIFHKLQELVAKRQISRDSLSGSDLAPSADTWGSPALRTEAERAADQEKQPWPRCRLWQLWPGKSQFTILSKMFIVFGDFLTLVQVQIFKTKSCEGFTSFELFLSSLEGGLWLSNHLLFQATLKEALESLENDRAEIQAKIDLLI